MAEELNPVLQYADSYRDMARQGVEKIGIWSVITDLERNIAPLCIAKPKDESSAQLPSQGGEAVEVVGHLLLGGYFDDDELEPNDLEIEADVADRMQLELVRSIDSVAIPLMTVAQHQRILATATHPADQVAEGAVEPPHSDVSVPRAIAERMAVDAEQYDHEHAIVNDNVQLWQQPSARLTLTVGDLRTVRALLNGGRDE